jgi:hypothetical protein
VCSDLVQARGTASINNTFKGFSLRDRMENEIIKPTAIIMKTHVGYNVFVQLHVSRWLTYLSVNFPATEKLVARQQVHLYSISRFIDMTCTFVSHLH